jgi:hypothetical protein
MDTDFIVANFTNMSKGSEFAEIRAIRVNPSLVIRHRTSAWLSATFSPSDAEKEFIRVYPCASVVNGFLSASRSKSTKQTAGIDQRLVTSAMRLTGRFAAGLDLGLNFDRADISPPDVARL